jgi:hypothetical protein
MVDNVPCQSKHSIRPVPQLRRLFAGFPARRHGFEPGTGHMGFVVDKVVGFLRVLQVFLPIIPSIAPHSSSAIIRGWYNGPDSGRRTKRMESLGFTHCLQEIVE